MTVKVLVVAGGGGGGNGLGGGGGGGGYQYNASFAVAIQSYTVTVGDGGASQTIDPKKGNIGNNSVFSTITAYGGGLGTAYADYTGNNGGCGGGGGGTEGTGGTGSQGYNGANPADAGATGGGGGGTAANGSARNGGAGTLNTIYDDSNIYYGGGGGGSGDTYYGTGGVGGGGNGNTKAGYDGTDGLGGGGGGASGATHSGKGGSGIVIIRYATADFGTCTGGTKTTVGSETVHKFVLADSGTSMTFVAAAVAPTVTTQAASSILSTSFTGNGNITATGGANATRRGFCYLQGSSGDPTVANSVAYDDGDYSTGAYTKSITGLSAGTAYRVRAYAVNSAGTSYGATVDVTTATATSGNFFQFFLVLLAITLLTGCGVKNTEPLGEVIVEQQVKEPIVIQPKIIPVLTSTQKATLSTLVTKSSATATLKNKMTYQEALDYVKALNDQTVTREFKDKGLKDVMPILKTELINLTK